MLEEGLIMVERNENSQIVPYSSYLDKVFKDEIYIRYGQLNSRNRINGLGRKIYLKPKYYRE